MSESSSESEIVNHHHQKRHLNPNSDSDSESETNSSETKPEEESEEEIQVLSHKERRKRRKLSKQSSQLPTTLTPIPNPKPTPVVQKKGEYGIWVGNLLFTTTQAELEQFFQSSGRIIRFNFPIKSSSTKKPNHINSGCAYIDFEDEEGLRNALEKSECLLGGRKLLIKRSNDYSGRPCKLGNANQLSNVIKDLEGEGGEVDKRSVKVLNKQSKPPVACLFLGNLSFESTSESIMKHFKSNHLTQNPTEEDPGIRQIRLGTFEDTGKCKGFGFLDFRDTVGATKALMNLRNHFYLGRRIKIEYASEEAARRGGGSHASLHRKSNQSKPQSTSKNHKTKEFTTTKEPRVEEPREVKAKESFTKKAFQGRLTPGAVLANARRAPIGIIKNPEKVGKKIVFE